MAPGYWPGSLIAMASKARAEKTFADLEPQLQDLSEWMFHHPERALQEFETSRRLAGWLEAYGAVTYPAYGLATAFEVTVGTQGPRVVLCAEFDALPEVGHACGHNLIATAALGAFASLAEQADELGVRVTLLGTPAEEAYGGKVDLIAAGAFDDAAAAMMVHPAAVDALDPNILAVRHISVEYRGKDAHAAFAPQVGINALDAFVQAYVNISTLRQSLYPTDKVHGIVTHGGDAPNIIPSRTTSSWYVRAPEAVRLAELSAKVDACFEAAARATGCALSITQSGHTYQELQTNSHLAATFAANAARLGRKLLRGDDLPVGATGSTDMGNVSQLIPSIHPFMSIDSLPAVNHQPEFAKHTLGPAGHRMLRDGALAMAWTIIDLAVEDGFGRLTD